MKSIGDLEKFVPFHSSLSMVSESVTFQMMALPKTLTTRVTLKWFFSCVTENVMHSIRPVWRFVGAEGAQKQLQAGLHLLSAPDPIVSSSQTLINENGSQFLLCKIECTGITQKQCRNFSYFTSHDRLKWLTPGHYDQHICFIHLGI